VCKNKTYIVVAATVSNVCMKRLKNGKFRIEANYQLGKKKINVGTKVHKSIRYTA